MYGDANLEDMMKQMGTGGPGGFNPDDGDIESDDSDDEGLFWFWSITNWEYVCLNNSIIRNQKLDFSKDERQICWKGFDNHSHHIYRGLKTFYIKMYNNIVVLLSETVLDSVLEQYKQKAKRKNSNFF